MTAESSREILLGHRVGNSAVRTVWKQGRRFGLCLLILFAICSQVHASQSNVAVPIVWDEHALRLSVDVPNSNSWVYNATLSAMNSWNTIQQYFVSHYYANDTQPDRYYFYAANSSDADIQITPLNTLSFPNMIAYTQNLGQNRFHIYVATEVMTDPGMEKEYYLTLLHELGHVFGIGDVFGEYNDVMDAVVSNSTMRISTPDLYTIRLLAVSTLAPNTFVYLPPALPYTQFTFN